jgi:hypothetical protein
MSMRILPEFLMQGDPVLERLMLGMRQGDARMRAMMGMGRADPLGPMLSEEARAWLRHAEAGRIGGN